MKNYFQKAIRYLRECFFCLRTGASAADKVRLLLATLAFHINKRNGMPPAIIEARVRIGNLCPNLRLRNSGGDMFIFHEVLTDQIYKIDPAWLVDEALTIVDLGGNVGLASLALASQFPKARIVVVEPHPGNAALLRHNLQCLGDRAHIWEAAVSDKAGTVRLTLADEHYNASLVRSGPYGIDVPALTVAEILDKENVGKIDVLIIDIEGAERLILKDSPGWLAKVNLLLVELHEGYSQDQFRQDVAPAGLFAHPHGYASATARRI